MQDIVYKLVPGLQEAEMRKQREFYHKLGMEVPGDIKGEACSAKQHLDPRNGETKADDSSNKETAEEKQEEDNDYHRSDEQVSICLECNSSKLRGLKRKWIRCSAQATVLHLKKFIAKKLNLSSFNELDILCNEEILGKDHTLKFVVVTRWRFKTLLWSSCLSGSIQPARVFIPTPLNPLSPGDQMWLFPQLKQTLKLLGTFLCQETGVAVPVQKAPLLLHYRPKMDLL
ncbi:polycomb group RING finger protein 3 isoform X3 [Mastomys coucha]|nr:polycomb group RING finger protein 3 isoform X3 [Mastomys coucha]XP_031193126.1 polycomb group RING finger protein 3 isoform X3 [Mastomys coucha]